MLVECGRQMALSTRARRKDSVAAITPPWSIRSRAFGPASMPQSASCGQGESHAITTLIAPARRPAIAVVSASA